MLKPTPEAATTYIYIYIKLLATDDRYRQEREQNGHVSEHLFSFYFLYVSTHRHKRLEKGQTLAALYF